MKLWKTGWVTTFLVGHGSSTPIQQIVHCNNGDEPQMRIRVESNHFESVFDRKISDFELITRPVQALVTNWACLTQFSSYFFEKYYFKNYFCVLCQFVTKKGVDANYYERTIPNDELVVDFLTSQDCKFLFTPNRSNIFENYYSYTESFSSLLTIHFNKFG